MDLFLKACAGVLMTVFLTFIAGREKVMSTLLSLAACSMVCLIAMEYLNPVMDFIGTLETVGGLDGNLLQVLLKVTGIGMITEIAGLVCSDSGNASMGKTIQLLGTVVILWLSLPVLTAFMELLQAILGGL